MIMIMECLGPLPRRPHEGFVVFENSCHAIILVYGPMAFMKYHCMVSCTIILERVSQEEVIVSQLASQSVGL